MNGSTGLIMNKGSSLNIISCIPDLTLTFADVTGCKKAQDNINRGSTSDLIEPDNSDASNEVPYQKVFGRRRRGGKTGGLTLARQANQFKKQEQTIPKKMMPKPTR